MKIYLVKKDFGLPRPRRRGKNSPETHLEIKKKFSEIL